MDVDGTKQVRVTDNPVIDEYPTSHRRHQIQFTCTTGDVNRNGRPTVSGSLRVQRAWLAIAALGETYSYDRESFGGEDVWMMRTDGSQQGNLTSNPLETTRSRRGS
jgi:hypothetical protein